MNVSPWGARRSVNAGTSSAKAGEEPARRKSKVYWATLSVPGSVAPKPRPKGVGDGQLVHIPVLPRGPMGGRRRLGQPGDRMCPAKVVGSSGGKSFWALILRADGELPASEA